MIRRLPRQWWCHFVGTLLIASLLAWRSHPIVSGETSDSESLNATALVAEETDLAALTSYALQGDDAISHAAIQQLRKRGPEAVHHLMNQPELRKLPQWKTVLDAVAQQKDAEYSGLYWYTSIEQAMAAAQREKKPILSLRLLGNLTDELSCANSRYFRTALYPNPGVQKLLRSQFILHWQSVRAVPIITIDLGDGRQIRRTVTGNSLHLVLDEKGRPVDLIPGLYTQGAFQRLLVRTGPLAVEVAGLGESEFLERVRQFHQDELNSQTGQWNDYCDQAGMPGLNPGVDHPDEVWSKLCSTEKATMELAQTPVLEVEAHRAVVEHAAPADVAGRLVLTKSISEAPAMRLLRNVSRIMYEDSLRNEYHLHMQIHTWYVGVQPAFDRESLVQRTYSELFLSPLNDPWFGLSKPDVYSAVRNDGRIHAITQNTGH